MTKFLVRSLNSEVGLRSATVFIPCVRVDRIDIMIAPHRVDMGAMDIALDGVRRFRASGLNHTHWIFPVTVADPEAVIKALAVEGISAMRGLSNLTVIEDGSDNRTPVARSALAGSLLVPLPPYVR